MRRPLAVTALIAVVLIRLITWILPLPIPISTYEDGQTVLCEGNVTDIIYDESSVLIDIKNSDSEIIRVVLSDKKSNDNQIIPEIGCRVKYRGAVSNFRKASNPGEFNAAEYYGRQGYVFQLKNAELTGKSQEYDKIRQGLHLLKRRMGNVLELFFTEREVSVIKAMLLGEKKGLDEDLKSLYQQAGISHILAISGLHISILGMGLYRGLSRMLGKKIAGLFSMGMLATFLMMTGFSPSAFRAGMMFLLAVTAEMAGRTYDAPTALAVAAILLLAENPVGLEETGFLLSFLAAAGAVVVLPVFSDMQDLKEWLWLRRKESGGAGKWYREKKKQVKWNFRILLQKVRGDLLSGFCINLVTLPVVLSAFYEWNVLSVLVNLAVLPLMGILLGSCIFLAAAGAFLQTVVPGFLPFLLPFSVPVRAILYFYEKICLMELTLPFGRIRTGQPEAWQMILFCCGVTGILLTAGKMPRVFGILASVLLGSIFLMRPQHEIQMTMLDVGQGECIYIETEKGHDYLYDGGSTSKKNTGNWQILPFLKYEGVSRLELVFVSHCDMDHISGLLELLNFSEGGILEVGGIVLAEGSPEDEMQIKLREAAQKAEVPVYTMAAGDRITDGKCEFAALYPGKDCETTDRNQTSLVLRFAGRQNGKEVFSALLTGDTETVSEREMLPGITKTTVLDVAHHGSNTSSSDAFLDRAEPELALISCGKDNSYGHPHADVLRRLEERQIPVMVTAQKGAVTVRQKGQRITVETFSEDVD